MSALPANLPSIRLAKPMISRQTVAKAWLYTVTSNGDT